jgi:hypothetical protein
MSFGPSHHTIETVARTVWRTAEMMAISLGFNGSISGVRVGKVTDDDARESVTVLQVALFRLSRAAN